MVVVVPSDIVVVSTFEPKGCSAAMIVVVGGSRMVPRGGLLVVPGWFQNGSR